MILVGRSPSYFEEIFFNVSQIRPRDVWIETKKINQSSKGRKMANSISNITIQSLEKQDASVRPKPDASSMQRENTLPLLHPKESIGLAAFLGSPVAGGILLAHNLIKLSRTSQAVLVILGTIVVTGIMVAIGIAMPEGIRLGVIVPLAAAMGLKTISGNLLSKEYQFIEEGKAKANSKWIGVGVGILTAALIFGLIWISL